jgi:hypothetical protein
VTPLERGGTLAAGPLFLFGLAFAVLGLLGRRPFLLLGGGAFDVARRRVGLGGLRGGSAPPS